MRTADGLMAIVLLCAVGSGLGDMVPPSPVPTTLPPCLCSAASIYTGQTYCFETVRGADGTLTANTQCRLGSYVTCSPDPVQLPPGVKTIAYTTGLVSGTGYKCLLSTWAPAPLPVAPVEPPTVASCICVPAGNYGTSGLLCYKSVNGTPVVDCSTQPGIICSVETPLNNGTAKVCTALPTPATSQAG